MLACKALRVCAGARTLVDELSLTVTSGEMVFMLGVNGAGKTTTLHTLAGLIDPAAGKVELAGARLTEMKRSAIARSLGLVMQTYEDAFPVTVLETVMLGRQPHKEFWQLDTRADRELALAAIERVGLSGFEQRNIETLSGGERRRVGIATILAQDPEIFLLDEPVNHLDPYHQLEIMRLFRQLADDGRGVLISAHDVNLAARFADRVVALYGVDGRWECAAAEQFLTGERLGELYRVGMRELAYDGGRVFVIE